MNIHQNARLTRWGREEAVRRVTELGQSARQVARALQTTDGTVRKWVARQAAGLGLEDRSSRPRVSPHATPAAVVLRIKVLRQQRRTCGEIARAVGVSRATVARVVARCGWLRLHVLAVPPTSRRYERAQAGELLHLDIKKLGRIVRPGHRVSGDRRDTVRGAGWEFSHMAVDDASRLACGEMLPDERGATAAGFLRRTVPSACGTSIPVAIRRPRTARSSASSKPRCWSGRTRASIGTPTTGGVSWRAGCTITSGIGLTVVLAAEPRSPGSSPQTTW